MDFSTTRLWFARLVMVYAFAINAFLGWLYMFEPQKHIAKFGVAVSGVPESLNFLRRAGCNVHRARRDGTLRAPATGALPRLPLVHRLADRVRRGRAVVRNYGGWRDASPTLRDCATKAFRGCSLRSRCWRTRVRLNPARGRAKPVVAAERAGITAFQGTAPFQPARYLNFVFGSGLSPVLTPRRTR